ncbi:MAG: TolC family protein [Phycisphaerales bacterium]|nr:TolC family protein [Phycisphaerales bacterium]
MNTTILKTIAVGLVAVVVSGCASTSPDAGFDQVRDIIAQRTGHQVQWRGHGTEDTAIDEAVGVMLAHELTVDQAVQIALLNNRHLQADFEDLGIAQADLVRAGLLSNPVFAASWRFPDRPPSITNAEYSISQNFLDILILPLRQKVARREFESTRLNITHQVLELTAQVKTAWYTLVARRQLLERMKLIVDLNRVAAELAQRQYQAGTANELTMLNLRSQYEQSRIDLSQFESQESADRERLNRLLGLWGDQTTWTLPDHLPDIPLREIPLEHLESLAIRQRLDLAAMRNQVIAMGGALAAAGAVPFPANMEIGLSTERDTDGQHVTGPTLSLELPIFDHGQVRIDKSAAQYRRMQRRYEAQAIDIRSQVRQARDQLVAQRTLAQQYQNLLPLRLSILQHLLKQYNGMLKSPYDLMQAKQRQALTEQAGIEARRDYWIARADLELALGGQLPQSQPEQQP